MTGRDIAGAPIPHWSTSPMSTDSLNAGNGHTTALLSPTSFHDAARQLEQLRHELHRVVVGQERVLERVLVALLAGGHCLLEGVPGLGKTLTVATLAQTLGGTFHRIQFTPDLLPSDLVGTRIYRPVHRALRRGAGPGVRQLHPGRRDQPGPGQGAVGPARGHGRAPGVRSAA